MAEKANLRQKLNRVMAGTGRLKKDGHNKFHNYDYVTEANVVDSIRELLVENGIATSETLKYHWQAEHKTKDGELSIHSFVVMTFSFLDTDSDETISTDWLGEGQDRGDKGFYKAYTGAQKYWLMKTFLIPTGDDPESDGNGNAPKKAKPINTPVPQDKITDAQQGMIRALVQNMGIPPSGLETLKEGWKVDHINELDKRHASIAITELLEMFLNKILALAENLGITEDERDKMYDRHGLDILALDGKALNAVYQELGKIAEGVE